MRLGVLPNLQVIPLLHPRLADRARQETIVFTVTEFVCFIAGDLLLRVIFCHPDANCALYGEIK